MVAPLMFAKCFNIFFLPNNTANVTEKSTTFRYFVKNVF